MHVETFFARNLGGLIRVRTGNAGPAHEGNSRTMSMHADEESDEVIVPEKRSNKEGLPSAETVEGRASPEGNGGQATAVRTPSRVTASNRLAAVRRAARQKQRCAVHRAAASHHHRFAEAKLHRAEA